MDPLEFDAFICCGEPSGSSVARTLAVAFVRDGFRVFFEERSTGSDRRAAIIDETPDFVLVLTPEVLVEVRDDQNPLRREAAAPRRRCALSRART